MELAIIIIVLLDLLVAACTFPYHIIYDPSYASMRLNYAYACNRCNRGNHAGGARRRSTGGELRGAAPGGSRRRV